MKSRLPIGIKTETGIVKEVELVELDGYCREILSDQSLRQTPAKLVTALLKHCVVSIEGVKITDEVFRKMFTVDRNAIMLDLQISSMGVEVKAKYECSWCKAGIEIIEDLSEFPFTEWPVEDYKETVGVTLNPGYTDKDGGVHTACEFRIPLGVDEEVTWGILKKNYGEWCNRMIVRQAVRFGTLDMDKFAGLGMKVAQSLKLPDVDRCVSAITKDLPGYNIMHEVDCPSCGKKSSHILDMSDFF